MALASVDGLLQYYVGGKIVYRFGCRRNLVVKENSNSVSVFRLLLYYTENIKLHLPSYRLEKMVGR